MAYMVNGLMAQFRMRVRPTGLTLLPALTTSPKSILTMMGYIIKKRQIAMGIETTGAPPTSTVRPSRNRATSGASRPSRIPAPMHRITQTVRYFSKNPSPLGCLVMPASVAIASSSWSY